MVPIRTALVGLGKISVDQHIPSIRDNATFELVAGVSPRSRIPGLPVHATLEELFASTEVDAVAINTPPQVRTRLARQALLAGKHVLLEKPPTATLSELAALDEIARCEGVTLFTGWHSQHAPGVPPAREWLVGKNLRSVTVTWCENVRQWHPGQSWIWEAGGLGIFDPGINALSILVAILPVGLAIERARFEIPMNCQTPIAADLAGSVGNSGRFTAKLDFLQTGLQTWSMDVETDRGSLQLTMGGAELVIDGKARSVGPSAEYPSMYRRFAELVAAGKSEVDARPMTLVADAFLVAEHVPVEAFVE